MNLYYAALDRNPANGTVRAKLVEVGRASL
jgi:hypothetical protein